MENDGKKVNVKDVAETFRTAGLLVLFSAFLLVEGVVRTAFLIPTPDGKWDGNESTFPPVVSLVGSVVEITFGLSGVFLALLHLTLPYGKPPQAATLVSIVLQSLGWFTFVVWTIAAPGYNEAGTSGPLWIGLTKSQSQTVTAMSILGSVAVCFSLQGAQFFLAFKILRLQKGEGHILDGGYYRSRLYTFSVFTLIGGASQLTAGIILKHALGGGQFTSPVVAPPFIVFYPELTITTGAVVIVYALVLLAMATSLLPQNKSTSYAVAALAAVVFLLELGFQNLGQGFAGGALEIANAELVGLLFALVMFPAYLVLYLFEDDDYTYVVVDSKQQSILGSV